MGLQLHDGTLNPDSRGHAEAWEPIRKERMRQVTTGVRRAQECIFGVPWKFSAHRVHKHTWFWCLWTILLTPVPLTTDCWPEAPGWVGGGGGWSAS